MMKGSRRCTESNVKAHTPSLAASGRGSGERDGGLAGGHDEAGSMSCAQLRDRKDAHSNLGHAADKCMHPVIYSAFNNMEAPQYQLMVHSMSAVKDFTVCS